VTVGVDLNTPLLSFQNPRTGVLEGFEVDIAHAIARAIFGDDRNRVVFVPLTTAERQTAVESGQVDMVVDAFTITCDRMAVMAFSAPYFVAHQKLLVPSSSPVRGIGQLAGKRICATAGSTSSEIIAPSGARFVPVPTRIDCLVLLEEHRVDAITSDDAILAGLQSQDPLSKIVPLDAPASIAPPLGPYGIAIPKDPAHRQLVRFVNAVLARMGQDGEWSRLYDRWLRRPLNASAHQPPVTYKG
jgi:polar amino acid transport system substrate-binding protein